MDKNDKYSHWIDSARLTEDIKDKSIKGGISTSTNQLINFGLNLISTFILARILLPSDFGLIGMVTAFTGFSNIIQDMGLSMAVIQKERITQTQVSNLFWINISVCLGLALVFVGASPLIVSLYNHDTRIYPIILSYAVGIAIGGLSIQHNALLSRKMYFGTIAKGHILATAISVLLGIVAALLGMGYWSIVILNISGNVLYTCFIWFLCDWRPSIFKWKEKVKDFIHFGAGISGFNVINYFSRNCDNILIGNRLGPTAVGFYSKAFQLLTLPINQLRNPLMTVAIPAMSALKEDVQRYTKYYRKYVFVLAFFSMPLVASLAIFSRELITVVLGTQWTESSYIYSGLAISAFVQPVSSSIGLVMISYGHSKRYFIWGCINSCVTILGFLIGIHWGTMGVVYSLSITTYGLLIPALLFGFSKTPIKPEIFFNEISLPFIHTIALGIFLYFAKMAISDVFSAALVFTLVTPLAIILYYLSWKLYPMGKQKIAIIEDVATTVTYKFRERSNLINRIIQIIRPCERSN